MTLLVESNPELRKRNLTKTEKRKRALRKMRLTKKWRLSKSSWQMMRAISVPAGLVISPRSS